MKKSKILIIALLIFQLGNAQFGSILSIGKGINNNISKNKKDKLFAEYLSKELIKNDSVFALRVPADKIKSNVKVQIITVQKLLETAKENFKSIKTEPYELEEISKLIEVIENNDSEWKTKFYKKELNIYSKDDYLIREKISTFKKDNLKKERQKELKAQDSLDLIKTLKSEPYKLLENHLLSISSHRYLTFFCGLDQSFVNPYLSNYLQEYMMLSSDNFTVKNNKTTERYIPKSSNGQDYINVSYYTKKTKNKPYFDTDDGLCNEITKCEIIGSADIIINLFLTYWPQKVKIGGYKNGELAHFNILGDRVSIYGISPKIYKIEIVQDNVKINYYEVYKIK